MAKEKSKLRLAQEKAEDALNKTIEKIDELGSYAIWLYDKLDNIQELFDIIRRVPSDKSIQISQLKEVRMNWKKQAKKIEQDYQAAKAKSTGSGAAGIGIGVAAAAFGPTAAMGIATALGAASTGTVIPTLSGATAYTALAWLGGSVIAAGGGSLIAVGALPVLGPVGWAVFLGSGLFALKEKTDQKRLEEVFTLISERDEKKYHSAIVELNARITDIKAETAALSTAIEKIPSFGTDYDKMTEEQQYKLGSYVNLMEASTQLLVNPIMALQPKYSEKDLNKFVSRESHEVDLVYGKKEYIKYKKPIITLANLFYSIEFDDKDRKVLIHSFRKNKEFLSAMNMDKNDMDYFIFHAVEHCLQYKYEDVKRTEAKKSN